MLRVSLLCILTLTAFGSGARAQSQASSPPVASIPDSVSPLAHARDLVTKGRLNEAASELESLAAQKPDLAGVERLLGFVYYQQGKLSEAEAAFAKALQQEPTDKESMQMRGVTLFRMGRASEAIPLLEGAHIAVSSTNIDPNYVLAVCYITVRRYDDARRAFAAQYGFPPDSAPAYLIAARMLFRQELTDPANAAARKALEINPRLPLAHRLLGEIALAKGDFPQAIAELQKERDINPLDGELYSRLGDAYLRSGQPHEAQQALDEAVLLEPNATGPYILLGKALLQQQEPVIAVMYLERAVQMDPSSYMAHTLLGQAYHTAGRKDDAAREFQAAGKLLSASPSQNKPQQTQ